MTAFIGKIIAKRSSSPRILESALLELRFILKLILLYITTTSEKCNVDYLVLLLACWNTLNCENYFRSFSPQFIFSHTANKQEEEYSHWCSAPLFLLLVVLYDLLQFSDQHRTYLYARDLCMYVLSLFIYSPSTSFINPQSNLLTVRHTFQMCSSFEQSMEKSSFLAS